MLTLYKIYNSHYQYIIIYIIHNYIIYTLDECITLLSNLVQTNVLVHGAVHGAVHSARCSSSAWCAVQTDLYMRCEYLIAFITCETVNNFVCYH